MTVKPGAQTCQIKEMILEDPVSNLIIQFSKNESNNGCTITLYKGPEDEPVLQFGNRDLSFDAVAMVLPSGLKAAE